MNINNGTLVISLDFELLWGVFDKVNYKKKIEYFSNTRKVIPEILKIFETSDIHCTWATVGMLFNENWEEWKSNIPEVLPEYKRRELSAYDFGNKIISKETEKLCFAPDLIKQIAETPNQEVGTHTYSHYYCLEDGQTLKAFAADLKKSVELAKKIELQLKSLVFPRNQFNKAYLKICDQVGIESLRSNPDAWYWKDTKNDGLIQKIFRTGDAYAGGFGNVYKPEKNYKKPYAQKASRFLRPFRNDFTDRIKINRIKSEMIYAARKNKIYHLWWHPHNFGNYPEKNMAELSEIVECFKFCREKYNFQSATMHRVSKIVNATA
ncbi:polysaccharide deacetylase family protein [Salegentibacter mishustinae]|uniref:polysaccharide deacetylase family protein n=1 Tax=Salegentibacter mishustinae TaxID=270918 RepID=UPI002493AD7B|nr:polysaccharide deacetylase family protein [Salegentibacter mishustinae]